jgi:hypothetical protein
MLINVQEAENIIKSGKMVLFAGEEKLLKRLPKGEWVGGTIPYFIDENGGIFSEDKIFANIIPDNIIKNEIKWYDEKNIDQIAVESPENGFSFIIIPSNSKTHITYARNAPDYEKMFLKPVIGWISGFNLNNHDNILPKVFNGKTGESSDSKAIVMHFTLPAGKIAEIGIINIFKQGTGDKITFNEEGFSIKECLINGEKKSFSDYLLNNKIDVKLPLVANYNGTMVNVSVKEIKKDEKVVTLYAPVFKDVEYRVAAPVKDYGSEFINSLPGESITPVFSCNCILNYLYSELEGKKTGKFYGPVTFGEIAYQLLNQTLTYTEIKDI